MLVVEILRFRLELKRCVMIIQWISIFFLKLLFFSFVILFQTFQYINEKKKKRRLVASESNMALEKKVDRVVCACSSILI